MIGQTEILIIAGVAILLFGATALPKLARSIGKAKAEFRKGLKEGEQEENPPAEDDEKKGDA
jgi:sec-independent protein translocase protein TatA